MVQSLEASTNLKITELAFLASFVVNFVVGKLIHFTSLEDEVYNYYNDKRNIFNQIFVKQGWFWTTLVIVVYYATVVYQNGSLWNPQFTTRQIVTTAVRNYLITTLWWILFTQWCFGLPLMDKVFVWTGGLCYVDLELLSPNHKLYSMFSVSGESEKLSSAAVNSKTCRKLKGQWHGGHDPSGHVFLMTHSSIYLFFEIKQFGAHYGLPQLRRLMQKLKLQKSTTSKLTALGHHMLTHASVLAMLLIGLWWFMLLMTNIYFHSILEKFVGLLCGYCITLLYVLPRFTSSHHHTQSSEPKKFHTQ